MPRELILNQLKKLEKALQYHARGSGWIYLNRIDSQLKQELSSLPELLSKERSTVADQKLSNTAVRPSPSSQIREVISERDPVQRTQEVQEVKKPENLNLNPLEAKNLDSLKLRIRDCDKCQLSQTRSTVVFGQGNQKAKIMFIGEAPGGDEDRTGIAFVGRAGKLLTQIIHSIGLNRESVYICNIIKCRPPGNRNPNVDEIVACSPFWKKQLELIKPALIVSLGNVPTKTLLPDAQGIMKMRGKMMEYNGIPLLPTFHPSYLLRNKSALSLVWNDMRQIRQFIRKIELTAPSETDQQVNDHLPDGQ